MKVVSIINYKGGVGKTTITANLGTELACRGYRVLLIDKERYFISKTY
jgi:chromosome partitioning protein